MKSDPLVLCEDSVSHHSRCTEKPVRRSRPAHSFLSTMKLYPWRVWAMIPTGLESLPLQRILKVTQGVQKKTPLCSYITDHQKALIGSVAQIVPWEC